MTSTWQKLVDGLAASRAGANAAGEGAPAPETDAEISARYEARYADLEARRLAALDDSADPEGVEAAFDREEELLEAEELRDLEAWDAANPTPEDREAAAFLAEVDRTLAEHKADVQARKARRGG